ncbi:hypothetical protein CLOM_g1192 [Closterium sp. NIES-68]|nr:hypothetical protein CLOM_g1192 [Closterium sp. NIES-68]
MDLYKRPTFKRGRDAISSLTALHTIAASLLPTTTSLLPPGDRSAVRAVPTVVTGQWAAGAAETAGVSRAVVNAQTVDVLLACLQSTAFEANTHAHFTVLCLLLSSVHTLLCFIDDWALKGRRQAQLSQEFLPQGDKHEPSPILASPMPPLSTPATTAMSTTVGWAGTPTTTPPTRLHSRWPEFLAPVLGDIEAAEQGVQFLRRMQSRERRVGKKGGERKEGKGRGAGKSGGDGVQAVCEKGKGVSTCLDSPAATRLISVQVYCALYKWLQQAPAEHLLPSSLPSSPSSASLASPLSPSPSSVSPPSASASASGIDRVEEAMPCDSVDDSAATREYGSWVCETTGFETTGFEASYWLWRDCVDDTPDWLELLEEQVRLGRVTEEAGQQGKEESQEEEEWAEQEAPLTAQEAHMRLMHCLECACDRAQDKEEEDDPDTAAAAAGCAALRLRVLDDPTRQLQRWIQPPIQRWASLVAADTVRCLKTHCGIMETLEALRDLFFIDGVSVTPCFVKLLWQQMRSNALLPAHSTDSLEQVMDHCLATMADGHASPLPFSTVTVTLHSSSSHSPTPTHSYSPLLSSSPSTPSVLTTPSPLDPSSSTPFPRPSLTYVTPAAATAQPAPFAHAKPFVPGPSGNAGPVPHIGPTASVSSAPFAGPSGPPALSRPSTRAGAGMSSASAEPPTSMARPRGSGSRGGSAMQDRVTAMVELLGGIRMKAELEWPLDYLMHPAACTKYNQLFAFFSKLTLAKTALVAAKAHMVQDRRSFRGMSIATKRELLIVQQMQHAITTIHTYLMSNAVTSAWHKLQLSISRAASVAAVQQAHDDYLDTILERCFLVSSINMGKAITTMLASLASKALLFAALCHSKRKLLLQPSMATPSTPATTPTASTSTTPSYTHAPSTSTPMYTHTASSSMGGARGERGGNGGPRDEEAAINAEIHQLGGSFHADVSAILEVSRNQAENLPLAIRDLLRQLNYNRFYG